MTAYQLREATPYSASVSWWPGRGGRGRVLEGLHRVWDGEKLTEQEFRTDLKGLMAVVLWDGFPHPCAVCTRSLLLVLP